LPFVIVIWFLLSSCEERETVPVLPVSKNNTRVTEVNFYGPTQTITLRNLYKNNIFLVKVNTSAYIVEDNQTGGAYPPTHLANKLPKLDAAEELRIIGHPAATRYHATPSFIQDNSYLLRGPSPLASSNSVGDKYDFWVETVFNNGNFIQREATLQAIGEYCKIWVIPNSDYSKTITRTQAETLVQKFDIVYSVETNLLGYEFGGGPSGSGGVDGDPKIHILVYDIGKDYGGYFWAKDYKTQSQLNAEGKGWKTNNAEIFYIGAELMNKDPDFIYSSLIHEFQHMVNYNVKNIKNNITPEDWYNEMLSLMAEDVMSSLIGISTSSSGHIQQRIPLFLAGYFSIGITEWSEYDNTLSYSHKYAYGAYLLRNYGGAVILKEIMSNNLADEASITTALNKAYGSGINFQYTLKRFGEALLYTRPLPSGAMTFDKTVTNTINRITYISYGFNIWKIKNPSPSAVDNMHYYFDGYGPFIISHEYWADMPSYSIALFSHESWLNITGDVLIILERPGNSNIKFLLMVL